VRDRTASQTTTWDTEWVKTGWWATRGASSSPSISAAGRYVALALDADVRIDDQNGARDIYEYELANKASDAPSLSANGIHTAFESKATNFNIDTNGVQDTFVHQWLGLPETDSLDSAQSAPSSTGEDQLLPRPCSLGKPALPTSQESAQSSSADSTSTQAGFPFLDRFRCKIRPIPRPKFCLLALGCPPGNGGGGDESNSQGTPFPSYREKFVNHGARWAPPYDFAAEYKQDAQDIADGRYSRGVETCTRRRDGATWYWVPSPGPGKRVALVFPSSEGAMVIVKQDNGTENDCDE
jgi:hypothetical protein